MTLTQAAGRIPRVYLAHASEDHNSLAKPLAERFLANGIDVWLDEWEIRPGDSLRRKMEAGLASCTHFIVLLTPISLHKPWVETEIDVGFLRSVGSESRFIGIRVGVQVEDLSPFLRTLRCPEIQLDMRDEVEGLVADIYGVSRKPERGDAPRYLRSIPGAIREWSPAAITVAEYLVRSSNNGTKFDPRTTPGVVAAATGMPEEDIRIGLLDLVEAGFVEFSGEISSRSFWPTARLFIEFDRHFLDFDNEQDAVAIANWLISQNIQVIRIVDLAPYFTEWSVRRLNSALSYLDDARVVDALKAVGGAPWVMTALSVTDRTRRFVRNHG